MTIPTLTPPANPITVQLSPGATPGNWTATQSTGTVLATNSAHVTTDIHAALITAGVDPSALVIVYPPSGNAFPSMQLQNLVPGGV